VSITRIETFTRDALCIVRVTADDGAQGVGQAAPYYADVTTEVVHRMVAPRVLGRDENDIASLPDQVIDDLYKFTGSFVCRAVGGVDTAMYDLLAKRAGQPVCALLGGEPGPVHCYASSMRRDVSPEDEVARLQQHIDRDGFRALKVRVGSKMGSNADAAPGRTPSLIDAVGGAFGDDDVYLIADANGCYDVEHAVDVGRRMADGGFQQLEEPCRFLDVDATADATRKLDGVIAVSGGEQDFIAETWRRIITLPAVHIIQPDVCYIGGVARLAAVAKHAEQRGLSCMPHAANRSMLQVFTAHLLRAMPNAAPFMEWSIEPTPWAGDLLEQPLAVRDGAYTVDASPGWGPQVREDWLTHAAYRCTEA